MLYYTIALSTVLLAKWTEAAYLEDTFKKQKELVFALVASNDIKSPEVRYAMSEVTCRLYKPKSDYENFPDYDNGTGTETPLNMQAYALENLKDQLTDGNRALDVASGSGYLAACMAYMVGKSGFIVGQLASPEELTNATRNVDKNNPLLLMRHRVKLVEGDYTLGVPKHAPYDAIHVGTDLKEVPQALLNQLKSGGRMMIPITAPNAYKIFIYDKLENGTVTSFLLDTLAYDRCIKKETIDDY